MDSDDYIPESPETEVKPKRKRKKLKRRKLLESTNDVTTIDQDIDIVPLHSPSPPHLPSLPSSPPLPSHSPTPLPSHSPPSLPSHSSPHISDPNGQCIRKFDTRLLYGRYTDDESELQSTDTAACTKDDSKYLRTLNDLQLLEKEQRFDVFETMHQKPVLNEFCKNDFISFSQLQKYDNNHNVVTTLNAREDNKNHDLAVYNNDEIELFDHDNECDLEMNDSNTQITNIFEAAAEAESLISNNVKFSQWNSPVNNSKQLLHHDVVVNKRKSEECIMDCIIDDVESSIKKQKLSVRLPNESTPISSTVMDNEHTNSPQIKKPRKLNFDMTCSISSCSDNDDDIDLRDYPDVICNYSAENENVSNLDCAIDLDNSIKLMENINNLSVYYSQMSQNSVILNETALNNDLLSPTNEIIKEFNENQNDLIDCFNVETDKLISGIGNISTVSVDTGKTLPDVVDRCLTSEKYPMTINNHSNTNFRNPSKTSNHNNNRIKHLFDDIINEPVKLNEKPLTDFYKISSNDNEINQPPVNIGFTTGLGKKIVPSAKHFQKYSSIFQKEFSELNDFDHKIVDMNIGNRNSNAQHCIENDTEIKKEDHQQENRSHINDFNKKLSSIHFQNPVEINEKPLNKMDAVKTIFDSRLNDVKKLDENFAIDNIPFVGFTTGQGKKIVPSAKSLKKYSTMFQQELEDKNAVDEEFNNISECNRNFIVPGNSDMNQSDTNKSTHLKMDTEIKRNSLIRNENKVQNIFDDILNDPIFVDIKKQDSDFPIEFNRSSSSYDNRTNKEPLMNIGFSTRLGTPIVPSTKTLKEYSTCFQKEFDNMTNDFNDNSLNVKINNNENQSQPKSIESQTKQVKQNTVNKNVLKMIVPQNTSGDNNNNLFMGFQTSNGNKISLNENHLQRYTNIFEKEFEIDKTSENTISYNRSLDKNECIIRNTLENTKLTNSKGMKISNNNVNQFDKENMIERVSSLKWNHTQSSMNNKRSLLSSQTTVNHKSYTALNTDVWTKEVLESTNALIADELNNSSKDMINDMSTQDIESFFNANFTSPKTINRKVSRISKIFAKGENDLITSNEDDIQLNDVDECDKIYQLRIDALRKQELSIDNNKLMIVQKRPSVLLINKLIAPERKSIFEYVNGKSPNIYTEEQLLKYKLKLNTIQLTYDNFCDYKFNMLEQYDSTGIITEYKENVNGLTFADDMTIILDKNCCIGYDEIRIGFLSSSTIDAKLLPVNATAWFKNTYKWIITKLSSCERSFPEIFGGRLLTIENVLLQLKYRYSREIDNAERSAIRKIYEHDAASEQTMILFVSRILVQNHFECLLELSDGWYGIPTKIDWALIELLHKKKIKIGTKLLIQGAKLISGEEGCSPLEMNDDHKQQISPPSVYLQISANLTRRVRWPTKLGFYWKFKMPLHISLNSVLPNGGQIGKLILTIIRVYPMMCVDKNTKEEFYRSERLQNKIDWANEKKRDEIYERIHREITESKKLEVVNLSRTTKNISEITDAEELYNVLHFGGDCDMEMDELTDYQQKLLSDYISKENVKMMDEINESVEEIYNKTVLMDRKITRLLKLRAIDAYTPDRITMMTVWNPTEDIIQILQENNTIEVHNLLANGIRNDELQISAGKQTRYHLIERNRLNAQIQSTQKYNRRYINIKDIHFAFEKNLSFQSAFNEFDTMGFVVSIEESPMNNRFQSMYVSDNEKNLLCIKFWGNIKAYAYDDIIKVNKFLCINNLQWRSTSNVPGSMLPESYAMDFSTFTEFPKTEHSKLCYSSFIDTFQNIDLNIFKDECIDIIKNVKLNHTKNTIIETPIKLYTTPKFYNNNNNSLIKTPIKEYSPGGGEHRGPSLKERIERLERYPSPPPISPIVFTKTIKLNKVVACKPSTTETADNKIE